MSDREARLKEWARLAATQAQEEDPATQDGRDGEQWLHVAMAKHFKHHGAYLFGSRRVPQVGTRERREIDLIVVTPNRIHVFEVKSWSGMLRVSGRAWLQYRRSGEVLKHDNLLVVNSLKLKRLREYLAQRNIDLPRGRFSQKVVFRKSNLDLDVSIASHPDVITPSKLDRFLAQQRRSGAVEQIICSIIDYCLAQDEAGAVVRGLYNRMTEVQYRETAMAIGELRTWDKLFFHGSRMVTGDLRELVVGGVHYRADQFPPGATIRIDWTRNKWLGLAQALLDAGALGKLTLPDGRSMPISTRDCIKFHIVGELAPTDIYLKEIRGIEIG